MVDEVSESKGDSAEVFKPSVDCFDGPVGCSDGEVGKDVDTAFP